MSGFLCWRPCSCVYSTSFAAAWSHACRTINVSMYVYISHMISSGTDTSMRPQLRQTGHVAFSEGTYGWTHHPLRRKLTKALSTQKSNIVQVTGICANGAYKIEMVQRHAAWWLLRRYRRTDSVTTMIEELGWRTLEQRWIDRRLTAL